MHFVFFWNGKSLMLLCVDLGAPQPTQRKAIPPTVKRPAPSQNIIRPGRVAKDESIKLGQVVRGELGDISLLGSGMHLGQDLIAEGLRELRTQVSGNASGQRSIHRREGSRPLTSQQSQVFE